MRPGKVAARLLIIGVVVVTFTLGAPQSIDPIQNPPDAGQVPETTTTTSSPCQSKPVTTPWISDTDAARLSIAISNAAFECAPAVVIANGDTRNLVIAAQLAAAAHGPLLLEGQDTQLITDEVRRLTPETVYVVGGSSDVLSGTIETRALNAGEVLEAASALLDGAPVLQATGANSVGRAVVATVQRSAVITGPFEPDPTTDPEWVAAHTPPRDTVWLADARRPDLLAPVLAAAGARGESVLLSDPDDLRGPQATLAALRSMEPGHTVAAGGFSQDSLAWQLPALLSAPELPGGGLVVYPGRRLVALYGNPTTSALGVLGEQTPEESVSRVLEIAQGYDADGAPILPSFEIIATVASATSGEDNNYSAEMSPEILRPWIEVAGANGIYVILDLQPGRTDFLTQAKLYEEFLRLPYVGLALDSEWRLKPDQVHLRQIGSVDAAEINAVVEWLANLVRDENLPQKYLLLHQFRLDMIPTAI